MESCFTRGGILLCPNVSLSICVGSQHQNAHTDSASAAHDLDAAQQTATIEFSNQDCQHVFLILHKYSNSSSSSSSSSSSDTLMAAEARSTAVAGLPHWSASCRNRELGLPSWMACRPGPYRRLLSASASPGLTRH